MDLTPELLEKLAEAAHDVWMEGKIRYGWTPGSVTDKAVKIHTCLIPYDQLTEVDKESDRDLVRGIPAILAKAGLKAVAPLGPTGCPCPMCEFHQSAEECAKSLAKIVSPLV